MLKILLADDHAIVREGLKQLFAISGGVQVAAEASNGKEVLDILRQQHVDAILLDYSMPGTSGVGLIQRILAHHGKQKILVLSAHTELQVARQVVEAGAAGYLTKDTDPKTLVASIFKIASGGRVVDQSLAEQMMFDMRGSSTSLPHESLSGRELEIFHLLVNGVSVNDIADKLAISNKTVSTYKARLMLKMNCENSAQLIRYALHHGLTQ